MDIPKIIIEIVQKL